jgi:hypothetical protein
VVSFPKDLAVFQRIRFCQKVLCWNEAKFHDKAIDLLLQDCKIIS